MMTLPYLLAGSMAALLLGAALGLALQNRGWGVAALKGLMASFIGGLLVLHLLPEAYEKVGPISVVFVLLGFLVMVLPEKLLPHGHQHTHGRFFTAEMLWAGLILHQATDGMGLALAAEGAFDDPYLALVVIAHRLPVAAVVIWLFRREGKLSQAWLRILAMGLATIAGAFFSNSLAPLLSSSSINLFYAFMAGSFLHLMTHDFLDHHAHLERDRRSEFLAFVLGIVCLVALEQLVPGHAGEGVAGAHVHGAGESGFAESFLILIKETAPYLLLGLIISGLLHVYMPASPIAWLKSGRPLTQSARGMLFGLPLPICSCGVLPLFLSLSRKGVPPACAVAFLIATPELGVDSYLLSVKLLGIQFSTVRLLVAMVLPIVIALIAVRFLPAEPLAAEPVKSCCAKGDKEEKPTPWWRFAFFSLVDDIFPFVFFGLLVAAIAQMIWPVSSFGELVGGWDVLILGLLGIPFYVCASASIPFALILLQHGFSVGAVVVFLFAGPATNVATVLTVNKAFGPGNGLKLAATALGVAVVTGFLINMVYTPESLDVFQMDHHGWTWIQIISVAAIALLGLMSLYRSGPLHWIAGVVGMIPGIVHHPPETKEAEATP